MVFLGINYLIASRIPPGRGRKHSTASWTQRVRRSELDVALPGGILGPSGYLLGPLGGFWEAIPRLRLTFAFDALLGAVVAFRALFGDSGFPFEACCSKSNSVLIWKKATLKTTFEK